MKLGFLSDCHGNLAGLEASYLALKHAGVDQFICLGDLVGYGGQSNECVQFIKTHCQIVIAGNHDHALLGKMSVASYHEQVADTIFQAREQLGPSEIDWLHSLPMEHFIELDSLCIFLTHAHPSDYKSWCYYPTHDHWQHPLANALGKPMFCFYGHTHRPSIQNTGSGSTRMAVNPEEGYEFKSQPPSTWVINVGSCGQPRDGDNRACSALFDTENQRLNFFRSPYDITGTQAIFKERGIPAFLFQRLNYGM